MSTQDHIMNRLYDVLQGRKKADPKKSYAAKLYSKGTEKIAQKIGEEASEVIIEAVRLAEKKKSKKRREDLKEEMADLLFHVNMLMADRDIHPDEVFKILDKRFGLGGLDEKASRKKD